MKLIKIAYNFKNCEILLRIRVKIAWNSPKNYYVNSFETAWDFLKNWAKFC